MAAQDGQFLINYGEDAGHQFKRDFSHADGVAAASVRFMNLDKAIGYQRVGSSTKPHGSPRELIDASMLGNLG